MKTIILVALALAAVAVAAPVDEPVKILRSEVEQQPNGAYNFAFETEDGVKREENGEVKEVLDEENKPHQVVVVRGSYSYTGLDGQEVTISFSADENGFHPEGDSIPKRR